MPLEPQAQVLALNVRSGYISAASSVLGIASTRLERLLTVVTARQWHPEGYDESVAGPVGGKASEAAAGEEEARTMTTLELSLIHI